MKRWLTRVLVVLVLAAAAFGAATWYNERGEKQGASFRTAPVRRGDLLATISATGTLEPEEVVDVGAQVAGQILKFGADPHNKNKVIDYGTEVEEGMVLAEIDPALYNADVIQQQANLDQSMANEQHAEADLVRHGLVEV